MKVEIIMSPRWYQRTKYRLLEPISFCGHNVEAGFVTDGATVPRRISVCGVVVALLGATQQHWWLLAVGLLLLLGVVWFPAVGRYMKAAVVHDSLLARYPCDRHKADRAFLLAMKQLKIAFWRRWLMFSLVWIWSEVVMAFQSRKKSTQ